MRHKCLAAFIVFVLFFTIVLTIGFYEARLMANAKFINKALDDSGIYNNVNEFAELIVSDEQGLDFQLNILLKYFALNIDSSYLKSEVEKNSVSLFKYLNNETTQPNVVFDLRPLKTNMLSNFSSKFPAIVSEEVDRLELCLTDTLFSDDMIILPDCLPQGVTKEQYKNIIVETYDINEMLSDFPDIYNMEESVQNPKETFGAIKMSFVILKIGFWTSLIVSLILLGVLALLGRSYWPSIPRWIGLSLVVPSGVVLLLELIGFAMQSFFQGQYTSGVDQKIITLLEPILQSINQNIIATSIILPVIIFGLGWILIILSYAIPHPPEPKSESKQPQAPPAKTS